MSCGSVSVSCDFWAFFAFCLSLWRRTSSPHSRELKSCCWWPARRVTSTRSPHVSCSPWSPARRVKRWSKPAWTLRTLHLDPTRPRTRGWAPRASRRPTSPTRCPSLRVLEKPRWVQHWDVLLGFVFFSLIFYESMNHMKRKNSRVGPKSTRWRVIVAILKRSSISFLPSARLFFILRVLICLFRQSAFLYCVY